MATRSHPRKTKKYFQLIAARAIGVTVVVRQKKHAHRELLRLTVQAKDLPRRLDDSVECHSLGTELVR